MELLRIILMLSGAFFLYRFIEIYFIEYFSYHHYRVTNRFKRKAKKMAVKEMVKDLTDAGVDIKKISIVVSSGDAINIDIDAEPN